MALELKTHFEQPNTIIEWNREELLEGVEREMQKYRGVVYTDDMVPEAKACRAKLNSFCKALNDARIAIGKQYQEPVNRFKKEVDEVIAKVEEVADEIGGQINAFEEAKKDRKLQEIRSYWEETSGEYKDLIPYERVHQAKWLNASVSIKNVKAEIDTVLDGIRQSVAAIDALGSDNAADVKVFYYRTLSLPAALQEAEKIKAERAKVAQAAPQPVQEQNTAHTGLQAVKFKAEGTREQLQALAKFMRDNDIKYYAI